MRIGVDYYPEHWDKELWAQDAQLMAQTGVSLVRLAEFAWCRLEPSDNRFDFTWLDEAIDCFASNGIDIVLGTPTNCPPRWLLEKHPQIIPVVRRAAAFFHILNCMTVDNFQCKSNGSGQNTAR